MNIAYFINRLRASDIAGRMTKGALWSFTGTALGKFFVLLTGIICARILGKEGFGELGIIRSTLGMFIILGSGGIGVTATRYIAAYRTNEKKHAAAIYRLSSVFTMIVGFIITFILLGLSDILTEDVLNSRKLSTPIIIGSMVLLFSILNSSENGTLAGLEDFKSIAISEYRGIDEYDCWRLFLSTGRRHLGICLWLISALPHEQEIRKKTTKSSKYPHTWYQHQKRRLETYLPI